jgi:hypothetical protein
MIQEPQICCPEPQICDTNRSFIVVLFLVSQTTKLGVVFISGIKNGILAGQKLSTGRKRETSFLQSPLQVEIGVLVPVGILIFV